MQPGDRTARKCKGCGAEIYMLVTAKGHLTPVDTVAHKADGKRLLVFPDGTTGRSHLLYPLGYPSHFASCPEAERFRTRKARGAKD